MNYKLCLNANKIYLTEQRLKVKNKRSFMIKY